jgi:hypothetical protein
VRVGTRRAKPGVGRPWELSPFRKAGCTPWPRCRTQRHRWRRKPRFASTCSSPDTVQSRTGSPGRRSPLRPWSRTHTTRPYCSRGSPRNVGTPGLDSLDTRSTPNLENRPRTGRTPGYECSSGSVRTRRQRRRPRSA